MIESGYQLKQNNLKILKTIRQALLQIAIIVFLAEIFVMQILPVLFPNVQGLLESLLDSIMLTIFSTPFVYWFVIRPYIKEKISFVEKISHMAYHDPLTGLANRRLLAECVDKGVLEYRSNDVGGEILLIDLDGFKEINDKYGHEAGDAVLKEVAHRLQLVTRENDIVSRIGGDEFVILAEKFENDTSSNKKSFALAQKVIDEISKPIIYEQSSLTVGASIGIRVYDSTHDKFESLLREADTAMYASKKKGKGTATVFSNSLKGLS